MQTVQNMSFIEAIAQGFRKSFDFKGRARRTEYWYWTLFAIIANAVAAILEGGEEGLLAMIVSLILFIPGLSVAVRRLHDIGRSGWWLGGYFLISVVATVWIAVWAVNNGVSNYPDAPDSSSLTLQLIFVLLLYILAIAGLGFTMLVWYCTPGTIGPNRYGEDPKYIEKSEAPLTEDFTTNQRRNL